MGDTQDGPPPIEVEGRVKWFDAGKGFGFVVADAGGPDILLHANVVRNFGQSSVAEGAVIRVRVQTTPRGVQVQEILELSPPVLEDTTTEADSVAPEDLDAVPFRPARVKWFDKAKGFGFGNVFGSSEDVFIHVETLRRFGFADLQPGEAIAMKVVDGPRGKMAAEVRAWDFV